MISRRCVIEGIINMLNDLLKPFAGVLCRYNGTCYSQVSLFVKIFNVNALTIEYYRSIGRWLRLQAGQ